MSSTEHVPLPTKHGKVELILGPMFSGKTTELLRRIRKHEIANRRCVVFKYAKDARYTEDEDEGDQVHTHDHQTYDAISISNLSIFRDTFIPGVTDVIGIDEGQFFDNLPKFCDDLAREGKTVIVAALNGDFRREPWKPVSKLLPFVDSITMLTAVCTCSYDAPFSHRFSGEEGVEVIGGKEKYCAVCRKCYFEKPETPVTTSKDRPYMSC